MSPSPTRIRPIDDEFLQHERQLNYNIVGYDMQRIRVKGDGNCLFYAIAEGLIYRMDRDPDGFAFHVHRQHHLTSRTPIDQFADRLRKLCVEQWKHNEQFYKHFVTKQKISFQKEASRYGKSGVCDSPLGDIVPLTIANAFNVQIIIFTSLAPLSRIDVKPDPQHNLAFIPSKTIFLAYNQYGLGHYDAALPK